jgi:hypothetical protein
MAESEIRAIVSSYGESLKENTISLTQDNNKPLPLNERGYIGFMSNGDVKFFRTWYSTIDGIISFGFGNHLEFTTLVKENNKKPTVLALLPL